MVLILTAIFESLWFAPLFLKRGKIGAAPKKYTIISAILGMTLAHVLAILILGQISTAIGRTGLDKTTGIGLLAYTVLAVGIGEEVGKGICGYLMIKLAKPESKVDWILIMGAAGLGFGITEGILYAAQSFVQILRWVMPFHLMWQMFMGGFLYDCHKARKEGNKKLARKKFLIALGVPILMHGINDYLAIESTNIAARGAENITVFQYAIFIMLLVWLVGMGVFTVLTERWAWKHVKKSSEGKAQEGGIPVNADAETAAMGDIPGNADETSATVDIPENKHDEKNGQP